MMTRAAGKRCWEVRRGEEQGGQRRGDMARKERRGTGEERRGGEVRRGDERSRGGEQRGDKMR